MPNHFFVKVDMGEQPEDTGAHWATKRFSILGVPTVKLWLATDPSGSIMHDIKSRAVVPFVTEVESYG